MLNILTIIINNNINHNNNNNSRNLQVWWPAHPAGWRAGLQPTNPEAYELTTWAHRAGDEWLSIQCRARDEDKLAELLSHNFRVRRSNISGQQRHQYNMNYMNGVQHDHPTPSRK